jgi:hypothetical protein
LWLIGLVVCCFLIRLTAEFLGLLPLIGLLIVAYWLVRLIGLAYCAWLFAAYWSGLLAWIIVAR